MSTTRRAENGSPLRQERYASDPAFGDHLKASAVARKCSLMTNPEHKEICLYLQYASMQPGGLAAVTTDFLNRYGDRIGSQTMRAHAGLKIFSADIVRAVRTELGTLFAAGEIFPLRGDLDAIDPLGNKMLEACLLDAKWYTDGEHENAERARQQRLIATFPDRYPASD